MSLLLVTPKPSSPVSVHFLFTHRFVTLLPNLVISPYDNFPIFFELDSQSPLPPPLTQISFRWLMPLVFLILFMTLFLLLSSVILLHLILILLIAIILLSLIYILNKHAPLKTKLVHSIPSNPGLLLILMLSKFHVACIESGLALNLPLIFNVSVLLQINTMLLSSKPNILSVPLLFLQIFLLSSSTVAYC